MDVYVRTVVRRNQMGCKMSVRAVMMDPKDNVATLLSDVEVGTVVVVTSATEIL